MVNAIKKATHGYKPPSSEKARTVLLDKCIRDVEKDLTQVKDMWYTQGVSIVSDERSNAKNMPLINVLAMNLRDVMFEGFSGIEKNGIEISKFLVGAIKTVGPTNVLQVVIDNAAKCKAARRMDNRSRRYTNISLEGKADMLDLANRAHDPHSCTEPFHELYDYDLNPKRVFKWEISLNSFVSTAASDISHTSVYVLMKCTREHKKSMFII